MSQYLPNGSVLSIAASYATSINVTAASNAVNTVLSAANTLVAGDFIEVTSGWNGLNGRVFRVLSATGTTITLDGLDADTTNTTLYPNGSGLGSVRKINTFTQVQQVTEFSTSGGDLQYATFDYLEETFQRQIPTVNSPQSIAMKIGDDVTLPGFIALRAVARTRAVTAMRLTLPNGNIVLYNAIFGMNETPDVTKNQIATITVGAALQGKPVRY